MYYLNGEPLRLDKAFTDADGNQYPANWLRNSTQEQRDVLGITWVAPDPAAYYDQRFWWGVGNPKDLDGLKELWVSNQKEACNSLLAPTDWMVVRGVEDPGKPVTTGVSSYRADTRTACDSRETQILACADVEELEALIKAPATIEVVTQEYVAATYDGEGVELTPEVPEVREQQANPAALTAWPEQPA